MKCDSSVMYILLYIEKWENGQKIALWWQETYYLTQVYTRVEQTVMYMLPAEQYNVQ